MKKLNRKGFTLIELLAVIVILAVVLVVTIPSVIDTMNDARDKSLQNAADTVAEWFTKQNEIAVMGTSLGSGNNDASFKTFMGTNADGTPKSLTTTGLVLNSKVLEAAGVANAGTNLNTTVVTEDTAGSTLSNTTEAVTTPSYVRLNGTKVCVFLSAKSGGNFYVNNTTYKNYKSSGCN